MTPGQCALVEANLDLVAIIVWSFDHRSGHLKDEMLGVAREQLCVAAIIYNPEKATATFRVFASGFISRRLIDFWRTWNLFGRHFLLYEGVLVDQIDPDVEVEGSTVSRISAHGLSSHMLSTTSHSQRPHRRLEIMELLSAGATPVEISELLGCSPFNVWQIIHSLRVKYADLYVA